MMRKHCPFFDEEGVDTVEDRSSFCEHLLAGGHDGSVRSILFFGSKKSRSVEF